MRAALNPLNFLFINPCKSLTTHARGQKDASAAVFDRINPQGNICSIRTIVAYTGVAGPLDCCTPTSTLMRSSSASWSRLPMRLACSFHRLRCPFCFSGNSPASIGSEASCRFPCSFCGRFHGDEDDGSNSSKSHAR